MKKKLLSLGICALIAASALNVSAELQMTASYKLGDSMVAGGVTAKQLNFYDDENRLIRGVNIATDYAGDSYTEGVYYYEYDENGLLKESWNYQYQPAYERWDGPNDKMVYTYDEQGRLIKKEDPTRGFSYKYDEQGRMTYENYYPINSQSGVTLISEVYYTSFDENGNPLTCESDGMYKDYRFNGTFEYDEQGRRIAYNTFDILSNAKKTKISYTYDELGVCTEELHYKAGSSKPDTVVAGSEADTLRYNKRITREAKGNGWYHRQDWTYSPMTNTKPYQYFWTKNPTSYNELYVDVKGEYAPLNLVVENISTKERPQTVKLTFDVPTTLPCDASYAIWRSGMLVGTATAVDGKVEYIDEGMTVGTYDYIVQTYDATNDVYYNTSDIVSVDVTLPLTPASNVRVVGGYWGKYSDAQTPEHDSFIIKLAWDVEDNDLPILGYRVWVYPWAYPMKEIEGDVKSCELPMTDAECADIRVDVVYEHGIKNGEYTPLFWSTAADFEGEPLPKYYLTYEKNYGDHMGGAGASGINYYIYDSNNNLSRRIDYGYQTDGSTTPLYHYFYEYNEKGQIISEYYRQMNAMGEWGKNKMPYVYSYDNMGRLVSKEDTLSNRIYEYTYDLVGRLSTMTDKGKSWGQDTYDKLYSTTYYKEYDDKGNATYVEFVHAMYASSSYNTTYQYDEQGRVILAESIYPDEVPYEKFEYTYDKYGVQTSMTKYVTERDANYQVTGNFVLSNRTIREAQGNAVYKRYNENYNTDTKEWTNNGRYTMETYSPLNGSLAPKNLVVTDISTPQQPNTIEVECNFPNVKLANAQYIIWRGWIPVDTVTATAAQGIIRYKDVNVQNGTYEYFVQTYDAASGQSFNATAPAVFTLEVELSPVTEIRYIGQTEGIYKDADVGDLPAYWVHFEWDAPETTLEVLGYNVYQDGYKIPVSTTTNCNDSVWVYRDSEENIADQQLSTKVSVGVIYGFGESEWTDATFEIVVNALEKVTLSGSAYVAGKTLYVEPKSQVTIYSVGGSVVATYNDLTAIDLANMPNGVYVAVVKVGDTNQVLKVAL